MNSKALGFVLDCSFTMAWCFPDEISDYTIAVQEKLLEVKAIVPNIWPYEVANILCLAERKKRITNAQAARFKNLLKQAGIIIDNSASDYIMTGVLDLAREQTLFVYDAAYLELAMREGLSLATLDK
jgi:predicted nucleic acid-binding protein